MLFELTHKGNKIRFEIDDPHDRMTLYLNGDILADWKMNPIPPKPTGNITTASTPSTACSPS